ncbi:LOW QUALITY PROTEIN: NUT family member 2G-like, partial [Mustela putorius furo]|uniref:LOW QUALITY PROTEIN: NUT family member 2G-like n=1 Tax=Mustela putorius furo TaxID=9669 RepID=A0A8U0UMG8_MUSPF
LTQPFPPGGPLVLPAFSRTPLVAGEAGLGPNGTGTCNVTVQVRSEQGCSVTPQTQTIVLTPAPLSWSAPGALGGGLRVPAPIFVTASAVETSMPASARGGSQAGKGGLAPSLPPPAQPPVAQLTTVVPPVNARPQPHGASRSRTTASPQDSCNPKSVYENFRRWQRFKSLARRHLPQPPDAEALSCFLIPVLRTLARLKPKMTLEEGVRRAVQEWQSKSNFDRLIYYEMAGKFMEFEMEEEMQMRKLQWVKVAQGLPPPAPPKPERRGPPAAGAGPQPACVPRKAGSRAQPSRLQPHRPPRRRQTKAPKEIPPEAVREYVDIMEGLLGPGRSAPGGPAGEWGEDGKEPQQDEAATSPDPGLLSYLDELCSQEDFITKVEAVIHPSFLAELLSSEPQLDLLALAEKLEQEEGLSPAELVEKRLAALNTEEGVQAPPRLCAARSGPSAEHETGPGMGLGVSDKACPAADTDGQDLQRRPLHPGPDGSPPLRRGKGAPPLDRAPEMPRFSERPLLLGTLEGWWMGPPTRAARTSPQRLHSHRSHHPESPPTRSTHQAPGRGGDQCEAWTPEPRTRPRTRGPPVPQTRKRGPQTPAALSVLDTRTQTPLSPSTEARPSCPRDPRCPKADPESPSTDPKPSAPHTPDPVQNPAPRAPGSPNTRAQTPKSPSTVPGSPNPRHRPQAYGPPGPQVPQCGRQIVRTPNPPPHKGPTGNSQEPPSPLQGQGAKSPPEGLRDAPQHAARLRHGSAGTPVPAGHSSRAHTRRSRNTTDRGPPALHARERAPASSPARASTRWPRAAPPPAAGPLATPPPSPRRRAFSRGQPQRKLGAVAEEGPGDVQPRPLGRGARARARARDDVGLRLRGRALASPTRPESPAGEAGSNGSRSRGLHGDDCRPALLVVLLPSSQRVGSERSRP